MAPPFAIIANVVDARYDQAIPGDVFFVDTNIWYWQTYTRASQSESPPAVHQTREYPAYISRALYQRARLLRCGLSLGELCHVIERVERELYIKANGEISSKQYRHDPTGRARVMSEVRASWSQVERMTDLLGAHVDSSMVSNSLKHLGSCGLDGYDALMLEAALRANVRQVITDDGDFCTVPDITVFTCNRNVIEAARVAGKLLPPR